MPKKFDKKELEDTSLRLIEQKKLFFIEDLVAYLPCSRATFYNYGLDKLDSIKDALDDQKVEIKVAMRKKWFRSNSATLQLALMKLIGTEEEAHRLNGSKFEGNLNHEVHWHEEKTYEADDKADEGT